MQSIHEPSVNASPDQRNRPELGFFQKRKRPISSVFFYAAIQFLIGYRRTAIGPLWMLVGPALFIAVLGRLYAHINQAQAHLFIPFLTVGLVCWSLIQVLIMNSSTVFQRNRAQILEGVLSLDDIVVIDVLKAVLAFMHQVLIIVVVFILYDVHLHSGALLSLVGLAIVIANGIWIAHIFGILGARYRDVSEVFNAVLRIAFLATPIMWMPTDGMQGGALGAFLIFNPFYHILEVLRAPLLGQPISALTWGLVLSMTAVTFLTAKWLRSRYGRFVPLWV